MDWSQWLIAILLALAIITGRPNWLVAVAMVGNFIASASLNDIPKNLAVADMICIAILISQGRRAKIVAALFLIMQPVYSLRAVGLNDAAIYALIDCIAVVQFAVLGHWDVGWGRFVRSGLGRLRGGHFALDDGYYPAHDMARTVRVVQSKGVDHGPR